MEKTGSATISIDGTDYPLTPEDLIVTTEDLPGWKTASEEGLTVALDVNLTPALIAEGIARDLVNRIQNLRKDAGFQVTDRINIAVEDQETIRQAVVDYGDYICAETLADRLDLKTGVHGTIVELHEELTVVLDVTLA